MISLIPLPYRIGLLGLICAALYVFGMMHGESVVNAKWSASRAAIQAAEASDAKLSLAKERALQEKFDSESAQRQKEKTEHEKAMSSVLANARRGDSGMRAPGACPRIAAAPADSGAASRPVAEEGYVLLPETAESVLDAASDLRQGVLDRNALIDAYQQARATCNAP